jgi:prepilin-type N-terminal cleavage/methylation domain-containing protein
LRQLARLLRARRGQRGYTLVETMIAMALLSLVTAAAFSTVNVMSNQAAATTDRFTAQGEGQTIADRITKDLRTAVAPTATTAAFASAGPNDVVFYANLNDLSLPSGTGPIRLHAYASLVPATNVYIFHEDATVPGGSVGAWTYTATPIGRIDGQYLDTSQPMFKYYRSDGTEILPPIITIGDLRSIDAVAVTLRIRVHPKSPLVVVSTRVHIRNVDYNPTA